MALFIKAQKIRKAEISLSRLFEKRAMNQESGETETGDSGGGIFLRDLVK